MVSTSPSLDNKVTTLAKLISTDRPLGFVRWWQELSGCCPAGLSDPCVSLFDRVGREVQPFSEEEARQLAYWEGILLEFLGLRAHLAGKRQEAKYLYLRSQRAYQCLSNFSNSQRIKTLAWLLESSRAQLKRQREYLSRYLDESFARIEVVTLSSILNLFLETGDWQIKRAALDGLSKMGNEEALLAAWEDPDLRIRREALTLSLEAGTFPSFDKVIRKIRDEHEDWYIQLISGSILGQMPISQNDISDKDWGSLTWTPHELVRAKVMLALGRWNPDLAGKIIREMLPNDPSYDVYFALCHVLMDIGSPDFIEVVEASSYQHHDLLGRNPSTIREECLKNLKHGSIQ